MATTFEEFYQQRRSMAQTLDTDLAIQAYRSTLEAKKRLVRCENQLKRALSRNVDIEVYNKAVKEMDEQYEVYRKTV